ncbi:MAG TPA: hypothetical protein PKO09_17990 [Anaerolineae bacterium]|nr:hypothetical protein [Anaerolineae bacterium]
MRRLLAWCAILLVLALGAAGVYAGVTASYTLDWWTVDGGGGTFSTGDGYSLGGTAGQPDAGLSTGGAYVLGGGFWGGGVVAQPEGVLLYLPLVMRSY